MRTFCRSPSEKSNEYVSSLALYLGETSHAL
jgi:hypothetical protein